MGLVPFLFVALDHNLSSGAGSLFTHRPAFHRMPYFRLVSLFLFERLFSHVLNSDGVKAVFARPIIGPN